MPAQDLSELKHLLRRLPPGDIPEELREEIIGRLQNCWHEFSGFRKTKMEMGKLSRAEDLAWRNSTRLDPRARTAVGSQSGGKNCSSNYNWFSAASSHSAEIIRS